MSEGMSAPQPSDDELREFLEADGRDVRADSAFKERLRRRLWDALRARDEASTDDPDDAER